MPFGWKPTILEVVVPRYRCVPCRRIWRHSITAAAPSKGKLSRDAVMLAVKSIVVDRMSIARVAANLGVAWNTASDAILAAGTGVPPPRPAGDALVLDLPTSTGRSLAEYAPATKAVSS